MSSTVSSSPFVIPRSYSHDYADNIDSSSAGKALSSPTSLVTEVGDSTRGDRGQSLSSGKAAMQTHPRTLAKGLFSSHPSPGGGVPSSFPGLERSTSDKDVHSSRLSICMSQTQRLKLNKRSVYSGLLA